MSKYSIVKNICFSIPDDLPTTIVHLGSFQGNNHGLDLPFDSPLSRRLDLQGKVLKCSTLEVNMNQFIIILLKCSLCFFSILRLQFSREDPMEKSYLTDGVSIFWKLCKKDRIFRKIHPRRF